MKKPMSRMLIIVGILFGLIFGYKTVKNLMIAHYLATLGAPVVTVSAMDIAYTKWQPQLQAAGSLRAVQGVNVTTELSGMIRTIYFTPGTLVNKGDLLAQLDVDPDTAQLHALQANAELAALTYQREKALYKIQAISKATLDMDAANLKSTQAQAAQQTAVIAQKTIRAPFSGRLGISAINPGQYINPGDKITMLQTLDPIYVDFYVPQQTLRKVKVGQPVTLTVDTFPKQTFNGTVTAIDPGLDPSVRNIEVEATLPNPSLKLAPGMFGTVTVNTNQPKPYLTLPLSAVSFNPYGELVYVITESQKDKKSSPLLAAKQVFIITGEKRGDQITVLRGLKKGDKVVTSGQLKLKNGSIVVINNAVIPTNNPDPKPVDE
jgi:membrane fusion protein (multidrug efflux system)